MLLVFLHHLFLELYFKNQSMWKRNLHFLFSQNYTSLCSCTVCRCFCIFVNEPGLKNHIRNWSQQAKCIEESVNCLNMHIQPLEECFGGLWHYRHIIRDSGLSFLLNTLLIKLFLTSSGYLSLQTLRFISFSFCSFPLPCWISQVLPTSSKSNLL